MKAHFVVPLILVAAAPAWGSDLPLFPFINVTGQALKAVSPDLARVNFAVKARDPSAEAASRAVSERAQQVLDLLAASGIAAADIDAHEIAKEVVFERDSGFASGTRRGPPRYEVSRAFSVLLRKVACWPDLGTKLLEMQNIEGLAAEFDRSDRVALEAELLTAATHDAQQRAERLAQGFGQRLGAVQAVSEEPFEAISSRLLRANMRFAYQAGVLLEVTAAARGASAAQVLVPTTIPLQAFVNAIYRLEGAQH